MKILSAAILFLVLFMNISAGHLQHQSLAEVLKDTKQVYFAEIIKVTIEMDINGTKYTYVITPQESLFGRIEEKKQVICSYYKPGTALYDEEGELIMRISPLISGSGFEGEVFPRSKAIFLFPAPELQHENSSESKRILRIESLENKETIIRILDEINMRKD